MIEPCVAQVLVSVTFPLSHRCPYRDEEDRGEVTIGWLTKDATFELHRLRAYLDTFADDVISHEEITRKIWDSLAGYPLEMLTVRTVWATAGGSVEVSA